MTQEEIQTVIVEAVKAEREACCTYIACYLAEWCYGNTAMISAAQRLVAAIRGRNTENKS